MRGKIRDAIIYGHALGKRRPEINRRRLRGLFSAQPPQPGSRESDIRKCRMTTQQAHAQSYEFVWFVRNIIRSSNRGPPRCALKAFFVYTRASEWSVLVRAYRCLPAYVCLSVCLDVYDMSTRNSVISKSMRVQWLIWPGGNYNSRTLRNAGEWAKEGQGCPLLLRKSNCSSISPFCLLITILTIIIHITKYIQ